MTKHVPVLLPEVLTYLDVKSGETILDATVGSAGYSLGITTSIGPKGTLVGIDADAGAVRDAKEKLKDYEGRTCLQVANFRTLLAVLEMCEIRGLDAAVFDLGFRSEQLEMNRGFSFQENAPLIMSFTHPDDLVETDVTARDIVNDWSQDSLLSIFEGYGNENFARRIAQGIISGRKKKPIETTSDLVRIIKNSVPLHYRNGRRHPATRTFQAIRIAVNDEMNALQQGMKGAFKSLKNHGRLVIVSFHSL